MKEETQTPSAAEGGLNAEAVFSLLKRFWWLILLFAAGGGTAACFYAERQTPVYRKIASVMLKDTKSRTDAASDRILQELGADPGAANLSNESYILKSTALMQHVTEKLRLNISYRRNDGLRTVSLYNCSPLEVKFDRIKTSKPIQLTIIPDNNREFTLQYRDGEQQKSLRAEYNKKLELPEADLTITPTPHLKPDSYGVPVSIRRDNVRNTAAALLSALNVTRPDLKDASILEMSITCEHPEMAEDILNELIEAYNRHTREERSEAARSTNSFIMARLRELGHELGDVEKRIRSTCEGKTGALRAESLLDADFQASQALAQEIFDRETRLKLLDSVERELELNADAGKLLTADAKLAEGLADKLSLYNEASLEYAGYAASAGSRNPVATALRDKMHSALTAVRQTLAHHRETLEIELEELRNKQKELEERMSSVIRHQQELRPLLREQKVKEALYTLLLTKEQENALALAIASPTAKVLESAHGSDSPVTPDTAALTAMGATAGAALCGIGLLGLGALNTRIRTAADIEKNCTLPVVGELPRLTRRERRRSGLIHLDKHSVMSERLHILRNNADKLLPRQERGGQLILITSTIPNEGKTFISANLAAAYAGIGRRVLLIDADLRKQSLTRSLGGYGHRGFTDLLLHEESHPEHLLHPLPGCEQLPGKAEILYAGSPVPEPVTLLSQAMTSTLLHSLQEKYDAVIVDSPPYGLLADTDVLAEQCSITLYVICSGKIRQSYLKRIEQLADSGRLPHVALILNGINFRATHDYYHGYDYRYSNTGTTD